MESAAQLRKLQINAISRVLKERGIDRRAFSPAGVALLMATLARGVVMEETLGISLGHSELRCMVRRLLTRLEAAAPRPRP